MPASSTSAVMQQSHDQAAAPQGEDSDASVLQSQQEPSDGGSPTEAAQPAPIAKDTPPPGGVHPESQVQRIVADSQLGSPPQQQDQQQPLRGQAPAQVLRDDPCSQLPVIAFMPATKRFWVIAPLPTSSLHQGQCNLRFTGRRPGAVVWRCAAQVDAVVAARP